MPIRRALIASFASLILALTGVGQEPTSPENAAAEILRLLEQLQGDPATLEAVRDELQNRINTAKTEERSRSDRGAAIEMRLEDLKIEIGTQQEEIAARHREIEKLEQQSNALATELEQVRTEGDAASAASPALERTLKLLDAIVSTLPEKPAPPAPAELAAVPAKQPVELSSEQRRFFEKQVLATLAANCFKCHGPDEQKSGMRLDSLAGMLNGGERGPAIVPFKPAESRLVSAIRREGELKMPPETPLSADAVEVLTTWIELGAPWPDGAVVPAPTEKAAPPADPAPTVEVAAAAVTPATFRESAGTTADSSVDFNRDIRPIFSNNCYACHGPDEGKRKGGLRLDDGKAAFTKLESGATPLVPRDRGASELFRRISTADVDDRMPPKESEHQLSAEQVELIGRWIDAGAEWAGHWSFTSPKRPEVPQASREARNPIDQFIAARLAKEGLQISPEADRRTLIRRATLDLTGLPPTPGEVDAFVNDASPAAYEAVVDRLLASPRYGEHMARQWLDLARYADTNGYHIDNERYMWRWRDWVIDAFNRNMPFDEFTVEQLAGDLLPEPSLEQLLATGFNRNHMINFEGGAIPEEYRVQYVIDRLDATSTVWMGLTVACAQCHDHKFDPISQREFYQMFAFFNTIPEEGLDGREGNAVPLVKAPLPEQSERIAALDSELAAIQAAMKEPMPELDAQQASWETEWRDRLASRWTTLDPRETTASGGAAFERLDDGSVLVSGANADADAYEITAETGAAGITAIRLEALTDASTNGATGRAGNGNFVLSEFEVELAAKESPEQFQRIPVALANADFSQEKFDVAFAIDGNAATGWAVQGDARKENRTAVFALAEAAGAQAGSILKIRLAHQSSFAQHGIARFRLAVTTDQALTPARFGPWYVNGPYMATDGDTAYKTAYEPESAIDLAATYDDGRRKWVQALPGFADGQVHDLYGDIAATYLYRTIYANTARTVTLALGSNDANKLWLNGQVVHDNNVKRGIERDQDRVEVQLNAGENKLLMKVVNYGNDYAFFFRNAAEQVGDFPMPIESALAKSADQRSVSELDALQTHFRRLNSPEWRDLDAKRASLAQERNTLEKAIPTSMVMGEMATPRETHILLRGQYDQLGEKVDAAVPAAFPLLGEDAPRNRLGFARWLVSPEHPLTSRVVVNRFWQHYFGVGIVKTSEDFGAQGAWPTHPELLDWLATEFIASGWDVKALQRLIVTSAVYRQDSRSTRELQERDPENLLLARGPRLRLDAEMVRDNALAISGLLVEHVGGPSVKPYQPGGLWEEVAYGGEFSAQKFQQDSGEALYRRSMYTFWKRQAPPPQMLLFDAPNRETCTSRRARTNTPLQALALLNDPQYVEASRAFAERLMRECSADPVERVNHAFQLATSRPPSEEEKSVLLDVLSSELETFKSAPESAQELLAVGESEWKSECDPAELAAWSTVTSMILNLDETITKS